MVNNNFELRKEELIKHKISKKKKVVVNAGLLKAGKSSLFNAVAGKNVFETDVVRATVKNKTEEVEEFILMDTPGLDACQKDTDIAMEGYKDADAILFVHNLQEGEFNQIEIDSIREMASLYGNDELFFKNVILVLSHKDQVENQYKEILKTIRNQVKQIFNTFFYKVFCVDSVGYLKGVNENKQLLIKDSGILELVDAINECINDEFDLNKQYIDKEKDELISDINKEIEKIKTKIPKNQDKQEELQLLEQAKNKIKVMSDKEIESVNNKEIELSVPKSGKDYEVGYRNEKSWQDYSSSSSARDAGKKAIGETIKYIARYAKEDCVSMVNSAEYYITANGVPEKLRVSMEKSYEEIRKILVDNNCKIRTSFNIILNIPNDANNALKYVRERANRIDQSFSEPEHYIKHDYDLMIDYDYKTEYVSTIFGGTREKEVKKYSYDARDAMWNVADAAHDKVIDLRDAIFDAKPPIREVFNTIKSDLVSQYKNLINDINAEVDKKISEIKDESNKLNSDIKKEQEKIDKLEQLLKEIADI